MSPPPWASSHSGDTHRGGAGLDAPAAHYPNFIPKAIPPGTPLRGGCSGRSWNSSGPAGPPLRPRLSGRQTYGTAGLETPTHLLPVCSSESRDSNSSLRRWLRGHRGECMEMHRIETGAQQVLMSADLVSLALWGHLPDQTPGPWFLCVCPLSGWPGTGHPEASGGRPCMGGCDIWTWLFEHCTVPIVWSLIWTSGIYIRLHQPLTPHPTSLLRGGRPVDVCVCAQGAGPYLTPHTCVQSWTELHPGEGTGTGQTRGSIDSDGSPRGMTRVTRDESRCGEDPRALPQ